MATLNQYGEIWDDGQCKNVCDISITYKNKIIDIGSEYGGTWVVRYGNEAIGKGHECAGTGFESRLEAFIWTKNIIGFPETWDDIIAEDLEFTKDRRFYGEEFYDYLKYFLTK